MRSAMMAEPRWADRSAAILDSGLLSNTTVPLEELSAFDLYRLLGTAAIPVEIEAEIACRRGLDPAPESSGYWQAFKDAHALIRALEGAEAAAAAADHDVTCTFSDGDWSRFDGSYAEFKASRLERCVEAHERLARLRDFADTFPLVGQLLAVRAERQSWHRQVI